MTDSVFNDEPTVAQHLGTLTPRGTTDAPGTSVFSTINRSDSVGITETGSDFLDFFSFTPYRSGSAEVSFDFSPIQGGFSNYLEMYVLTPIQGVANVDGPILVYNISAGYSQYLDVYLPQIEAALATEGYDDSNVAINAGTYLFDQTWELTGDDVVFAVTGVQFADNGNGTYVNPELNYRFWIDAVAGGGGEMPDDGPQIDGVYATTTTMRPIRSSTTPPSSTSSAHPAPKTPTASRRRATARSRSPVRWAWII